MHLMANETRNYKRQRREKLKRKRESREDEQEDENGVLIHKRARHTVRHGTWSNGVVQGSTHSTPCEDLGAEHAKKDVFSSVIARCRIGVSFKAENPTIREMWTVWTDDGTRSVSFFSTLRNTYTRSLFMQNNDMQATYDPFSIIMIIFMYCTENCERP